MWSILDYVLCSWDTEMPTGDICLKTGKKKERVIMFAVLEGQMTTLTL